MKIVAAMMADFRETFWGTPSQLATKIGSRSVFQHALARFARIRGVEKRCVFVRPRDEAAARAAIADAGCETDLDLLPLDDGARPRRELIQSSRKWALDAWRGGPLGTTWFDEYIEPIAAARILDHYEADAVLCVDGQQPVLDPAIAEAMLVHQRGNEAEADFVFTQAPPGVAGIVLTRGVVRQLLERQWPAGLLLAYRPEAPRMDLITKPQCAAVPAVVAQTPARLTGDTLRSRELLTAAFADLGENAPAETLCGWLAGHARAGRLPVEVELELTTADPLPETSLRPRGGRAGSRELSDFAATESIARQLAAYDDRLLVLGGHGDPLLHPRFAEIARRIRASGILGLGLATPLVELPDAAFEALFQAPVDVVEVLLDAGTAKTYQAVHAADAFDRVQSNVGRIQAARQERKSPQPIILGSLTRCSGTLHELEGFFDGWIHATGGAVIRGYNDCCGRLPADSLIALTPPAREPCRRLASRMTLLADGRAVACGQDLDGSLELGRWDRQSLAELWGGPRMAGLRQAHSARRWQEEPLCAACGEWFRA